MTDTLKLLAQSEQDLTIFSTLLQDAAVRVGDIAWLPVERRFAMVGSRYRWEKKRRFFRPRGERVRAALIMNGLMTAEVSGFSLHHKDEVLELLSITAEPAGEDFVILLAFAGGASIRFTAECIDASLNDLGETWDATRRPEHG